MIKVSRKTGIVGLVISLVLIAYSYLVIEQCNYVGFPGCDYTSTDILLVISVILGIMSIYFIVKKK